MPRHPIRIGLIAEGPAELGTSVPYLYDPKQGGTIIDQSQEGALHTLIRRQLAAAGLPECVFVHRHRTSRDNLWSYRTGHSVIEPRYLAQTIIAWKPNEVDLIAIVVDEDNDVPQRDRQLAKARQIVIDNHVDAAGQSIADRHVIAKAIKTFDTWLIADQRAIERLLQIPLPESLPDNLELLSGDNTSPLYAKTILDQAIDASAYTPPMPRVNNRNLEARWALALLIDLTHLHNRCRLGYGEFVQALQAVIVRLVM